MPDINGCPPSSACLIDDTTSFILLGGWQSETVTGAHTRVTRYSTVQYSTVQYNTVQYSTVQSPHCNSPPLHQTERQAGRAGAGESVRDLCEEAQQVPRQAESQASTNPGQASVRVRWSGAGEVQQALQQVQGEGGQDQAEGQSGGEELSLSSLCVSHLLFQVPCPAQPVTSSLLSSCCGVS